MNILDWAKGLLKEKTTWAGLALWLGAIGNWYCGGPWEATQGGFISGFWMIVLKGRPAKAT